MAEDSGAFKTKPANSGWFRNCDDFERVASKPHRLENTAETWAGRSSALIFNKRRVHVAVS
jgi:hypothetical protein